MYIWFCLQGKLLDKVFQLTVYQGMFNLNSPDDVGLNPHQYIISLTANNVKCTSNTPTHPTHPNKSTKKQTRAPLTQELVVLNVTVPSKYNYGYL